MIKTIQTQEAFVILNCLDDMLEEHIKIPISTSIKLIHLRDELKSITDYISNRIIETLPKISSGEDLNDSEKEIYNAIMLTTLEIDNENLTINEFSLLSDVKVDISSLEKLVERMVL